MVKNAFCAQLRKGCLEALSTAFTAEDVGFSQKLGNHLMVVEQNRFVERFELLIVKAGDVRRHTSFTGRRGFHGTDRPGLFLASDGSAGAPWVPAETTVSLF